MATRYKVKKQFDHRFTGDVTMDGDLTVNGNEFTGGWSLSGTQVGDLNGRDLIIDADGDTLIRQTGGPTGTDDSVDVVVAGAVDFRIAANLFTALAGSTIAANTIAETTEDTGVTVDGVELKDGVVTGDVVGDVTGDVTGEHTPLTEDMDADGTISIASGFVAISKDGVGNITLTDPAAADDGKVLTIMDVSGNAHVVTYATGFNGGSNDLATFGGTASDNVRLRAWGEVWYVEAAVNVTLSEDQG